MVGKKGAALALAAVAVVAVGGVAMAKNKSSGGGGGGGGGGGPTPGPIPNGGTADSSQAFFNGLQPAQRAAFRAGLYQWYTSHPFPETVGDPNLKGVTDLNDAGNLGITVDAFQQEMQPEPPANGVAGVVDQAIYSAVIAYAPAK